MIPYTCKPWTPRDIGVGFETNILIQSRISLRHGLPPDDLTSGIAHDNINMRRTLCDVVDIMAETVSFGEEDFGQIVGLPPVSLLLACASASYAYFLL